MLDLFMTYIFSTSSIYFVLATTENVLLQMLLLCLYQGLLFQMNGLNDCLWSNVLVAPCCPLVDPSGSCSICLQYGNCVLITVQGLLLFSSPCILEERGHPPLDLQVTNGLEVSSCGTKMVSCSQSNSFTCHFNAFLSFPLT